MQIKDLILGAGLTEIKDREEYLKKQTEAQYEVDESRIVEAVREVLARHEVKWGTKALMLEEALLRRLRAMGHIHPFDEDARRCGARDEAGSSR